MLLNIDVSAEKVVFGTERSSCGMGDMLMGGGNGLVELKGWMCGRCGGGEGLGWASVAEMVMIVDTGVFVSELSQDIAEDNSSLVKP